MDWDRRAFVKFAVGGVTGLHLSPLVWKLMDDVSIWTQNWSWVPNPADGALAKANSFNPATGTAVKVRLINSRIIPKDAYNPDGKAPRTRAIRVEGNPEYPLGLGIGGVVPQDASALQNAYLGDVRVKAPMVLDKTTGVYKEISWGAAIDMVAGKLAQLKKADQAQRVVAFGDNPDNTTGQILKAFMAAYGSPNLAFAPRAEDTLALAAGLMLSQPEIGFDLLGAKYILSLGTPLLEGFGAPVTVRAAFTKWREGGAKLVQVEDRASVTASQAAKWVACAPGSQGVLALAMCQVLLAKGLAAEGSLNGLDDFKALVDGKFTPKAAAHATGLKPAAIEALAVEFGQAKQAVAVCGPGPGNEPGRLGDFMAVLALNALKGNLGKPGGVVVRGALPLKPLAAPSGASAAGLKGAAQYAGHSNPLTMAASALAGDPYKPKMAIIAGANPAYRGPQAGTFAKMLRQVPFVVAISSYLDESATLADLLLPAGTFLESWGDAVTPYGQAQASYGLHKPLLKIQPKSKAVGDALLMLAAKLGGEVAAALPYKSMAEALKARLGDGFKKVAEKGWWVQEKVSYGFNGSVDLQAATIAKSLGRQAASHGHSLTLAAVPSLRTCNNSEPITPHMIKILTDDTLRFKDQTVVEINPETAKHLHLHDGDLVTVDSTEGGFQARVKFFAGARPGMLYMPVGLGHTAFGFYRRGRGGNYNAVAKAEADAVTGLPVWGLTPVHVRKV